MQTVSSKPFLDTLTLFVKDFAHSKDAKTQIQARVDSDIMQMEKQALFQLMELVIQAVLDLKNRELYDKIAFRLVSHGFFFPAINIIVETASADKIQKEDYRAVARILELCACHQEGIAILCNYLGLVVELVEIFLQSDTDLFQVKYPAATVLLDLTASEGCIEQVSYHIRDRELFSVVIAELEKALARKVSDSDPNRVLLNRFRDLTIGIVLNLTCNVESEEVTKYMLGSDVVRILVRILTDPRHDWPTNGAALALLQYSHQALGNQEVFAQLEQASVFEEIQRFYPECKNQESRRHLYEALTLVQMVRTKMGGIDGILAYHVYAACA